MADKTSADATPETSEKSEKIPTLEPENAKDNGRADPAPETGSEPEPEPEPREELPVSEPKFSVSQLARSKRFRKRRDLLYAVLDTRRKYTIAEAEEACNKFLNGGV